MPMDFNENDNHLLLGENTLTKVKTSNVVFESEQPKVELENFDDVVRSLPDKNVDQLKFFQKLLDIRNRLRSEKSLDNNNKESLVILSERLLSIDTTNLLASDLVTFFETVDELITLLNDDSGTQSDQSDIISRLDLVSSYAHRDFDESVNKEGNKEVPEEIHENDEIMEGSSPADNAIYDNLMEDDSSVDSETILTTENEKRVILKLLDIATKIGGITKEHPTIKHLLFKATVSTATLVVKLLLKKDLVENQVEKEYQAENPQRRSFYEITTEGVDIFRKQHPETPVLFDKDKNFSAIEDWVGILNSQTEEGDSRDLKKIFGDYSPKVVGLFLFEALKKGNPNKAVNMLRNKLNLLKEKVDDYQFRVDSDKRNKNFDRLVADITTDFVHRGSEKQKSVSMMICICLEKTNGHFCEAMQLAGFVLKSLVRSEDGNAHPEWIRENILDEYSEFHSFNNMDTDEYQSHTKTGEYMPRSSAIFPRYSKDKPPKFYFDTNYMNRLGLPYHATDMVSLLDTFSPECILLMMIGEYMMFGQEHGALKFLSDLRVCSELYRINSYLKKASATSNQ